MSGDPRVTERSNPLVDRLNEVAELNRQLGTPLGGGGSVAPPPPGLVEGGSARVMLPPPRPIEEPFVPLDSKDALDLELEWENDPTNPLNRLRREGIPVGRPTWVPPSQRLMPQAPRDEPFTFGIDLDAGYIIVNGARMPMTKADTKRYRSLALKTAKKAVEAMMRKQLDTMREAFNAKEAKVAPVPEVQSGEGAVAVPKVEEAVPEVRSDLPTEEGTGPEIQPDVAPQVARTTDEGGLVL